jgi:hypothetical protein
MLAYTELISEGGRPFNVTAQAATVTLLSSAVAPNKKYRVVKVDSSANTITINLAPGDTFLDGTTTLTIPGGAPGFTVIERGAPGQRITINAGVGSGTAGPVGPPGSSGALTLQYVGVGGQTGIPYSASLIATGGTPTYTYAITAGALPPGLTLNASLGAITGIPAVWGGLSAAGTYTFTGQATDSATPTPATAIVYCTIVITDPSNAANLALNPNFTTGDFTDWYTSGTWTTVASPTYNGAAYAARIVGSGLLGENVHHSCQPSDQFYGSIWVASNSSAIGTATAEIICYNGASTLGTAGAVTVTGYHAGFVQLNVLAYTLLPTTNNIVITLSVSETGAGAYWYVDNVVLRPMVGTDQIALGSVTAGLTALSAINASTGALAANSVVDANVLAPGSGGGINVSKLNPGTNIFSGDVILSRGSGYPVIDLSSGGAYLFGVAASGGATGLTSNPYVVAQSSGVLVSSGGSGPSVFTGGSGIWIYSVNGSTSDPYMNLNSTGITIRNGLFSTTIGSGGIYLDYNGVPYISLDSGGLTLRAGTVLHAPAIDGGSITGSVLTISGPSATLVANTTVDGFTCTGSGAWAGYKGVFASNVVALSQGSNITLLSANGLQVSSVSCINSSGAFVGAGVACPSNGIGGSGFSVYSGGWVAGATFTFQDLGGATHSVKGGIVVY